MTAAARAAMLLLGTLLGATLAIILSLPGVAG